MAGIGGGGSVGGAGGPGAGFEVASLTDFSGLTPGLPSFGGGGVGVGLGVSDSSVQDSFGGGSPFDVVATEEDDEALKEAAADEVEEKKKRLRRGFAQTILTSPTGLGSSVNPSTSKTLGG